MASGSFHVWGEERSPEHDELGSGGGHPRVDDRGHPDPPRASEQDVLTPHHTFEGIDRDGSARMAPGDEAGSGRIPGRYGGIVGIHGGDGEIPVLRQDLREVRGATAASAQHRVWVVRQQIQGSLTPGRKRFHLASASATGMLSVAIMPSVERGNHAGIVRSRRTASSIPAAIDASSSASTNVTSAAGISSA